MATDDSEDDAFSSPPPDPTPSLQDALVAKRKKKDPSILDTLSGLLHDPRTDSIVPTTPAPSTRDYTLPGGPETGMPVPIHSPMGRTLSRTQGGNPRGNGPIEDWVSDTLGGADAAISTVLDPKADIAQRLLAPGDFLRYGVTPQQKNDLTEKGMIPGMREAVGSVIDPKTGEATDMATRYASNYLAAKQGHLPIGATLAGNMIALSDLPGMAGMQGWQGLKDALARKAAGVKGMVKGIRDSDSPLLNLISAVVGSPR